MTTTLPTTTLHFREGGSDKVYTASVEPSQNNPGYHVTIAYGRRGSTLTYGRKNDEPLPEADALKLHAKIVREKIAKGYKEEAVVGTRCAASDAAAPPEITDTTQRVPTMPPMLLNSIPEAEAMRCLADWEWAMQEKYDGRRLQVRALPTGRLQGFNKLGKPVDIAPAIAKTVASLGRRCLLDGEAVGDVFHVFDLLELDGRDLRDERYRDRYAALEQLGGEDGIDLCVVQSTPGSAMAKLRFEALRKRNAEGVVFKRLNTIWSAGRPNSGGGALKFKFVETASFIVRKVNSKRSVELGLLPIQDGQVMACSISLGNVTIPPNYEVPAVEAIVEVRYLYAYPGGCVYQPVYLGERDDVTPAECHTGQLKYKAATL